MRALLLALVLAGCRDAVPSGRGRVSGTAVPAPNHVATGVVVRLLAGSIESVEEPGEPLMLSELTRPVTVSPTLAAELDGGAVARTRVASATGDFDLDVAPGTYHLVLDAKDVGSFYSAVRVVVPAIEVSAGETTSVGDVELVWRRNPMDFHDGHETY